MAADAFPMTRSSILMSLALAFGFVASCGRPGLLEAQALANSPAETPGPAAPVSALSIPPRSHATEAPREGWCGETAIQEGLLSLGVWAPQRLINRAGHPTHPDLYSNELPVALTELGVRFVTYRGERGFDGFARWAAKAVDEGEPVIAGVKILPTEHPEWGLDHFVLVVGHGPQGLLVNTTWGSRRWVGDTTTPGLSLKDAFYGLRLVGVTSSGKPAPPPARLTVLDESETRVRLRVDCRASGTSREESVDAARVARFVCPVP